MFNLLVVALKFLVVAALYLFLLYVLLTLSGDVVRAGRRAARPAAAARLAVVSGPGFATGHKLPLADSTGIGRAQEADIIIDDRFASERHSRLTRTAGGFLLEDLGSTNGTYLGEHRITEAVVLADGDEFTVGQTTFRFEVVA